MVLPHFLRAGLLPNALAGLLRHRRQEKHEDPAMATEEDLRRLEAHIERLVERLNMDEDEVPSCPDEECLICVTGRAGVQSFPCGHTALCRKCFIRTIQVAVKERSLPLRCVLCRARVVRLKQVPARQSNVRLQPVPGTVPNQSTLWTTNTAHPVHSRYLVA